MAFYDCRFCERTRDQPMLGPFLPSHFLRVKPRESEVKVDLTW